MKKSKLRVSHSRLFEAEPTLPKSVLAVKKRPKREPGDEYTTSRAYELTLGFVEQLKQQYRARNSYGEFHLHRLNETDMEALVTQLNSYETRKWSIRVNHSDNLIWYIPCDIPSYLFICLICPAIQTVVFGQDDYAATINVMDVNRFN